MEEALRRYKIRAISPKTGREVVYEYTARNWKEAVRQLEADVPKVRALSVTVKHDNDLVEAE